MPRRKLSEYRAKTILCQSLGIPYAGWSVLNEDELMGIDGYKSYVLKVDQAEKRRFKKGLVLLEITKQALTESLTGLKRKGYEHFIVEPYAKHKQSEERYLSINYDKEDYYLSYSSIGGVDIEANPDSVKMVRLDSDTDWTQLASDTGFSSEQLQTLLKAFQVNHFTFLEINPYTVTSGSLHLLDAAVEVDDAGMFFVDVWGSDDLRVPASTKKAPAEETVARLDEKSPASFNLSALNRNGSIFLLLSGGGASVVVADEIHNHGFGNEIANYGEYSGNPTEYETYVYACALLDLLLESKANKKVLFIGGAVANFTDIANTFSGIIRAVDEHADGMKKQGVRVFVRRGGPRQEIGLKRIRDALETHGLLGDVYDPHTSINQAVDSLIKEVRA